MSDVNHNDHKKMSSHGRMAYITVTENAIKWWITVQGLNHREVSGFFRFLVFIHIILSISAGVMERELERLG